MFRNEDRESLTVRRSMVRTMPRGGHRQPMQADADLSQRVIGQLEAEFLERLDLHNVTLVGNDSGLFQIAAGEHPKRIARLVITSCEAFENLPSGLPGHTVTFAARLPGGLNAVIQPLRLRVLRRLPLAFGWMAKRPIPPAVTDTWLRPVLTRREIRRDLTKYLRSSKKGDMLAAAEPLPAFDRSALVIWAKEDRIMPPEPGRRLAEVLPNGRFIEIADSYTFIPEDQPGELARAIRQFVRDF